MELRLRLRLRLHLSLPNHVHVHAGFHVYFYANCCGMKLLMACFHHGVMNASHQATILPQQQVNNHETRKNHVTKQKHVGSSREKARYWHGYRKPRSYDLVQGSSNIVLEWAVQQLLRQHGLWIRGLAKAWPRMALLPTLVNDGARSHALEFTRESVLIHLW